MKIWCALFRLAGGTDMRWMLKISVHPGDCNNINNRSSLEKLITSIIERILASWLLCRSTTVPKIMMKRSLIQYQLPNRMMTSIWFKSCSSWWRKSTVKVDRVLHLTSWWRKSGPSLFLMAKTINNNKCLMFGLILLMVLSLVIFSFFILHMNPHNQYTHS